MREFEKKATEIVNQWMQDPREIALLAPGTNIDPLIAAISFPLEEAYDAGRKSEAAVLELSRINQELGLE